MNSRIARQTSGRLAWRSSCRSFSATPSAQQNEAGFRRAPVIKYPLSETRVVPTTISFPPYARTGQVPMTPWLHQIGLHEDDPGRMRDAARLARKTLDMACALARPGMLSDDIDEAVHEAIIEAGAYPSPLNYDGFPKSVCTSINEVICHGIPDKRPFESGDVVSFDVSCFLNGVHGDNCATIIVGDSQETDEIGVDWRGVPYKTEYVDDAEKEHIERARTLIKATRESLYAAIETCGPGSCLTHIGAAIEDVCKSYGYNSVEKYRGHGIGTEFHCAPFVKHFRNEDYLELRRGMIFTIEPMLTMGSAECYEWDDNWTVATVDGSLAAQFEHTVYITGDGVEILTLSEGEY